MAGIPDVGDKAPEFTLPSTAGEVSLATRLKKQAVLLVFYPGDDTAVCTKQLCDYRDNISVFSELNVDVLAVNTNSLESHRHFAAKHDFKFPLLADEDKSVCRSYGALGLLGSAKRALVLVGQDGKVKWRLTDFPLFRRSADELQEVIRSLNL